MIDISGEMWQEQRRFSLSVLRHFGIGRPVMEEKIMNETEKLIAQLDFQTNDGKTVLDVESLLKFCIGNIMSSLLFNESFNFGDAKFHCLVETLDKTFELAASTNALLLNSFPFFAKIPINGGFGFAEMIREEQKLREYFKESLKKHRSKQAIITEPDDFIDAYLKEIAIRQKSGDAGYFSEQQLIELIGN